MQANDAIRILGSAAAMGLLGGGGALAYNAISKPTVDEYGNTIESNDINPFVAALGGAAIGAASNYGFNKWVKNRVHNNLDAYGIKADVSPQSRQSPDIDIDVDVDETVKPPYPDFRNMSDDQFKEFYTTRHDYSGSTNDRKAIHTRMADIVDKEIEKYEQTAQAGQKLEQQPQLVVQVVPASPMELQNPMSPPGMKTVVTKQPPKEPGQEVIEEALRLRELAEQQRHQRQQAATRDMRAMGWNDTTASYNTQYPEDNVYNIAGWDLLSQPSKTRKALNQASDEERYQDWLLSRATQEAQKKRG